MNAMSEIGERLLSAGEVRKLTVPDATLASLNPKAA